MAAENQTDPESVPLDPAMLDWAEYWYPISWKGVLAGGIITAVGACATIAFLLLQWRTTTIREEQSEWRTSSLELQTAQAKRDTSAAQQRIAELNNETERLKSDNLALQTVMLPRHVSVIGIDGPPKAHEYFMGIEKFPGTEVFIQVANDPEALNLASEIAMAVEARGGWIPHRVDEKMSHSPSSRMREGVQVSYPFGKSWTAAEPVQPWFAWKNAADALAVALTRAGLGLGDIPISSFGFSNEPPDETDKKFGITKVYFDPPIGGVFLEIGPRPISATIQWLQGRRSGMIPPWPGTIVTPPVVTNNQKP